MRPAMAELQSNLLGNGVFGEYLTLRAAAGLGRRRNDAALEVLLQFLLQQCFLPMVDR